MNANLPNQDIVLIGAGHTHCHILRMWRMQALQDVRLTCISDFSVATYSGMLPGTLAGLYDREQMQIDLVRLCAASGIRFLQANVSGLDIQRRQVLLEGRPPVPYDVLSIGIGSIPSGIDGVTCQSPGDRCSEPIAIKPMQTFLGRLDRRLEEVAKTLDGRRPRIAVVGGGVAGIEITLALTPHVESRLGCQPQLLLIDRHAQLAGGLSPRAAANVHRELQRRDVRVTLNTEVREVRPGEIALSDGQQVPADIVLWTTGAAAPPLLGKLGLPTDERGFLLTEPTLQSTSQEPIFAVGDTGTIQSERTLKAGVYAVRQGPVLWQNLARRLNGKPLLEYRPQHNFLKLLSTGDRRAIVDYKGLSTAAAWCWKLKDRIDTRFMAKYQDYAPMAMEETSAAATGQESAAMRCAGCGGKVGSDVLHRALKRLDIPSSERVLLGLDQADDAAVLQSSTDQAMMVTTDFFTAFVDDPYLVGRVAALNAASDTFALGGRPIAALAMATLPVGRPSQQEQLLFEMLAGGLREFRQMGATLAGGHTIEGAQTMLGYTVMADAPADRLTPKSGLRPGDMLVLTKPLGTGVLLAAHMQARCRAVWYQTLVASMLTSNQLPEGLLQEFDIQAVTDVTGFGLAGHLLEMLRASGVAAEIELAKIPLLPGASELIAEGIESTLAPANRAAENAMEVDAALRSETPYTALFDPQTSGGLLLAVSEDKVASLVSRLEELTDWRPAVIGRVKQQADESSRLVIV